LINGLSKKVTLIMIRFELGIILAILLKLTECEWEKYGSYNLNIPGHVY
jgi:hypothetical protein